MGYQESFIYTTSSNIERNNQEIEQIIELFKKYDVRTIDDELGICAERVTFKKQLWRFKKGMQVLWIVGERSCQRHEWNLFDVHYDAADWLDKKNGFSKEEHKLISRIKMIWVDEIYHIMPKITDETVYASRESLRLLPESPRQLKKIEEFAEKLKKHLIIESEYATSIHALNEHKALDTIIHSLCAEMELPLQVKEKPLQLQQLQVPWYSYYINDVSFANYHDTPHLEKKGTWRIAMGSQNLRALARTLEDGELKASS